MSKNGVALRQTALNGANETVGGVFSETLTDVVPIQPFASVPVTVYTVAIAGDAMTVAPVAALSPSAGLHE